MDFYKLLGGGIKALRERRGYSQEQFAGRLRSFGLTSYKRVTVSQLEAGTRKPGVPELVLIAGTLDTTLRGLIPDDIDGHIELAPMASVSGRLLRAVLSDHPEAWYDDPPNVPGWDHAGESVQRFHAQRAELMRVAVAMGAESSAVANNAVRALVNEAERNVAKRLNVDVPVVCVGAEMLWGQSLTDEREKRFMRMGGASMPLGDRAAYRGHVTRELTSELAEFLIEKHFLTRRHPGITDEQPAAPDVSMLASQIKELDEQWREADAAAEQRLRQAASDVDGIPDGDDIGAAGE